MRRQDIHLRLLAKNGDAEARLKLGEAYLVGTPDLAKNIPVALDYLRGVSGTLRQDAARSIAQHLPLQEILQFEQLDMLELAARRDHGARLALAALHLIRGQAQIGLDLLKSCDSLAALLVASGGAAALSAPLALRAICKLQRFALTEVVALEAAAALARHDLRQAIVVLEALSDDVESLPQPVLQLVVQVLRLAEQSGSAIGGLPIALVHAGLERCALDGDLQACHRLGRALAGLRCQHLEASRLVQAPNLRQAAAWLLRAADGGNAQAWLDLHRICADYRCSVANPMMARFCLEKAVALGDCEAERRLGALELREATQLHAMERAVALLFKASRKGDPHATRMLHSLVLPVAGNDQDAEPGIGEVQRHAPLLAARMRLARQFGLTKLEALSVNPVSGLRPWGLVVEKNPFVVKMRLSEPRVVPARSDAALQALERASWIFSSERKDHPAMEGTLRMRAQQQRRLFESLQLRDAWFFSSANARERETIRVGTKWAQHQRAMLQMALAN